MKGLVNLIWIPLVNSLYSLSDTAGRAPGQQMQGRETVMSRGADRQKSGFGAVLPAILVILGVACAALFPSRASALEAHDYKMAGDATQMRVVINFDEEPEPRWFLLRSPNRLVIDLPKAKF